MTFTRAKLEEAYKKYNRRELIHPDPLEFLYLYDDNSDKEIVGLIASSLAYGRVQQILSSVSKVLSIIKSPREFAVDCRKSKTVRLFSNFKHRFTTGDEVAALLHRIGLTIKKYGSLGECFAHHYKKSSNPEENTLAVALRGFAEELYFGDPQSIGSLIPNVSKGSACKRLCLYLRWMVRKDDVDPGCWQGIDAKDLIVPLDTHMHRIGLEHGLTKRKNADIRTAIEITQAFAKLCPSDPVKYDFALTRPGIAGI